MKFFFFFLSILKARIKIKKQTDMMRIKRKKKLAHTNHLIYNQVMSVNMLKSQQWSETAGGAYHL